MKKSLIVSILTILLSLMLFLSMTGVATASNKVTDIFKIEYMEPDSRYYVFSQYGELILLDIDLHTVPLKHIPYYLPYYSRCVIIKADQTISVIYAMPPGRYVLPPLSPPLEPS